MASSATAVVRSTVSKTEFAWRRSGSKGASSSNPVLSKLESARASGYSFRIALTTARVKGEATAGEAIRCRRRRIAAANIQSASTFRLEWSGTLIVGWADSRHPPPAIELLKKDYASLGRDLSPSNSTVKMSAPPDREAEQSVSAPPDREAERSPAPSGITPHALGQALREKLAAVHVDIADLSGGCGQMFEATIVSPQFATKTTLARHRLVNRALRQEIAAIHAWTPKCFTPDEWERKQAGA